MLGEEEEYENVSRYFKEWKVEEGWREWIGEEEEGVEEVEGKVIEVSIFCCYCFLHPVKKPQKRLTFRFRFSPFLFSFRSI